MRDYVPRSTRSRLLGTKGEMKRSLWAVSAFSVLLPWMAWCQIGNITVTSAASFQPGVPPAGSIGTIFYTGLAVKGVVGAAGVPLPRTLAGVTVSIGGAPARCLPWRTWEAISRLTFRCRWRPKAFQTRVGYRWWSARTVFKAQQRRR